MALVSTRYIENRVGILVPPRHLDANCAYRYVNNLLSMNMKQWRLLPELKGHPVYEIILDVTTIQGARLEVHKDYSNNIYAIGIDDENVTGASVSKITVRYIIPSDTKEVFIIQDIVASEMLQCPYKVTLDMTCGKYRVMQLEAECR